MMRAAIGMTISGEWACVAAEKINIELHEAHVASTKYAGKGLMRASRPIFCDSEGTRRR
jgi:hypothetical protein